MAARRSLKVFRTSIGFQDAYVAAPSQKAALEAWGTDKDLFSRGVAERVTDPKLIKAPLAQPGVVLRASRGTPAQHLAAVKRTRAPTDETEKHMPEDEPPPRPRPKGRRPSRAKLARAEAALEHSAKAFDAALTELDARIERLRKERDQLRSRRDAEIARIEDRRDAEEAAYRLALDAWDG